jgi:hypothetical protein
MSDEQGRQIFVGGDVSGQVIAGDHNTSIIGRAEEVNLTELVAFAEAVREALPALRLDAERERTAEELTEDIIESAADSRPDHGRLREAGRTLRAIVEGAAANALAPLLLKIWSS